MSTQPAPSISRKRVLQAGVLGSWTRGPGIPGSSQGHFTDPHPLYTSSCCVPLTSPKTKPAHPEKQLLPAEPRRGGPGWRGLFQHHLRSFEKFCLLVWLPEPERRLAHRPCCWPPRCLRSAVAPPAGACAAGTRPRAGFNALLSPS